MEEKEKQFKIKYTSMAKLVDALDLDSRISQFKSEQKYISTIGGIGRHAGLKILSSGTGSNPVWYTWDKGQGYSE